MKIRQGFVSNSSTCSFMIYGVRDPEINIAKLLEGKEVEWYKWYATQQASHPSYYPNTTFEEWCDNLIDDVGLEDATWSLENNFGLSIDLESYQTDWGLYIGQGPRDMGDDETMGEFKERIRQDIAKIADGDIECAWHEEVYSC